MLPEILAGSYKRYKEDTNVFTTWLTHAAAACGYRPAATLQQAPDLDSKLKSKVQAAAPVKSQRLKGKERKLAKQAAAEKENAKPGASSSNGAAPLPSTKYTLSTQDLLHQVEAIAESTKDAIRMPLSIQRVLERAIQARERCAQWFDKTGIENAYSREGHRHFIDVLQNALDLLKAPAAASKNGKGPNAGGAVERSGPEAKALEELTNKFEVLDVEDVDETLDMTAADVVTPSKTSPRRDVYELELDPTWEAAFDIFCFFEDLHRIEDSLNETWRRYQVDELDLLSATIVTDAAISLVRRAETDLHQTYGEYGHSYQHIAETIFYAETFSKGEDPDELLRSPDHALRITEFDEFIYLPIGRTLIKFAQMSEIMQKVAWPAPVPPMRFSYIARPDFLKLPGMAKKEHEDEILTQLLLDLVLADTLKKESKGLGQDAQRYAPKMEDEFTNSVRPLWTEGRVTVQSVFASRIVLNILDLYKGTPKFYHRLLDAADSTEKSFDFFVDSEGIMDTGGGVRWLTKDTGLLMEIYELLRLQIRDTPFQYMKQNMLESQSAHSTSGSMDWDELPPEIQVEITERRRARGDDTRPPEPEHVENARRLNIQMIKPAEALDIVFTHNPLFCGTLALRLAVMAEEAGVALANHHLSIFATAHLYNALQQLGRGPVRWPAIEGVMQVHIGPVFAGKLPTTPDAIASRLAVRLGASSLQSARRFNERKPWKIQSTEVSRTLRVFFEQRESFEESLHTLEGHMQDHAQKTADLAARGKTAKGRPYWRQLTPLQFLAQMEAYLPAALPDMELDYVALTKTCNAFMKRLRSHIHRTLGVLHPSVFQVKGDTNDHGNLYMVLAILNDSREAARAWERLPARVRSKEPFRGGLQLMAAGEALEAFWKANDGPGEEILRS